MMHKILVLLLFLAFAPLPVGAQTSSPEAPQLTPKVPTRATGTAMGKDYANKIFFECVEDPMRFPSLDPLARGYVCSCLSAGYQMELSVEDYEEMKRANTPEGRAIYQRTLKTVYFPCTIARLKESQRQQCMKRADLGGMGDATAQGCACVMKRVNAYIDQVGETQIMMNLATAQHYVEPYSALVNSGEFQGNLSRSYYACFNGRNP